MCHIPYPVSQHFHHDGQQWGRNKGEAPTEKILDIKYGLGLYLNSLDPLKQQSAYSYKKTIQPFGDGRTSI
jgi:hypothetical protein